ncbi:hypothetical protein WR25_09111 [Diploscapter pachys]|uniref:Transmembrane protein 144 n=1 Tax=Diploscapter pachys TaxID=2018661 RepID=A0A2A2LPD4_9BILA|nr:hypothetical protein WR25_09111 [Diploscapter pachys]
MSMAIGLMACGLSGVLFGSCFVPVKKFEPGNGIFVQWVMCVAIWCVGLITYSVEGFPKFEPLAMLGGMFWALGNCTAIPIMNVIGMGLGMLIWSVTNCVAGWACGRFGLFGIKATIPNNPILNYIGLGFVVLAGFLFSKVKTRPSISPGSADVIRVENESGVTAIDNDDEEDRPLIETADAASRVFNTSNAYRTQKRAMAIGTALIAGLFYGVTFVPVIYMQDHPDSFPDAPKSGLGFVFSHFTGILATSTVVLAGYVCFTGNSPYVNPRIVGPSLTTGTMWAVAQSSWFVANDNLSQAVSFPIITGLPGCIAALWSVVYFK